MSKLSPAAQAVRDAVLATYADNIPKDDNLWALERASTVAALRAAADALVANEYWDKYPAIYYRKKLLAIADELEAQ